jgi:hypothetical protein
MDLHNHSTVDLHTLRQINYTNAVIFKNIKKYTGHVFEHWLCKVGELIMMVGQCAYNIGYAR